MGVISALRGSKLSAEKQDAPLSAACLNCGTPLTGPFCSHCGQRDVPPYPDLRELVVDAFWELSGWDGRFASTIKALALKPGLLTREFLEGRRARYISPLRLYLMASLVYFLVAAGAPNVTLSNGENAHFGVLTAGPRKDARTAPERVANAAENAIRNGKALGPEKRDSMMTQIARAPSVMRPFLQRMIFDPAGFKRGIVEAMPKMLFALLPVFAAIVGIFYRKRKYPEHLYFAIHLHAFVFIALTVAMLAKFTHLAVVAGLVRFAVFVWIPIYTTIAYRRAYDGSLVATLAKEVGIGAIYLSGWLVAFIATLYLVSRFG
jgi:hypothetical protein